MGQIAPRGANDPFCNHWEASARGANAFPPAVSNWEVEVRLTLPCSCYFVTYKVPVAVFLLPIYYSRKCLNCIWDAVRSPPICGHCYSTFCVQ
eukprot:g51186.t1